MALEDHSRLRLPEVSTVLEPHGTRLGCPTLALGKISARQPRAVLSACDFGPRGTRRPPRGSPSSAGDGDPWPGRWP
jgi:hypothetical protein